MLDKTNASDPQLAQRKIQLAQRKIQPAQRKIPPAHRKNPPAQRKVPLAQRKSQAAERNSQAAERAPLVALTLAGHDPSGGAGITADLLTFAAHGIYGYSAITALTVQSTLGLEQTHVTLPGLLRQVVHFLEADHPVHGIKIGMLGSAAIVREITAILQPRQQGLPDKPNIPIVLDPVLVSSSGTRLLDPAGIAEMRANLLPLVHWVTPNWAELAVLAELPVTSETEALTALAVLGARHPQLSIVATGGDQPHPTDLLRLPSGEIVRFPGERIATTSTHGTGCAFSSALLCQLLRGAAAGEAVAAAKQYVTEAIRRAPRVGRGTGPLDLSWPLRG